MVNIILILVYASMFSDDVLVSYCLVLGGLTGGWQADEIEMNCKIFKLNYSDFYFS